VENVNACWLRKQAFILGVLSLALLGYQMPAVAIVNMDELHFSDRGLGASGALFLNYSGANGNEDNSRIGMGFNYRYNGEVASNLVSANVNRGESNGIRDSNNAFVHMRHIRNINNNRAWEIFAQLEKNEFTRLKLRSLLGGGLREKITDLEERQQFLGLGLFYSEEKLDQAQLLNEDAEQSYTRVNFYSLNRLTWSQNTKLYFTFYAQPVINDWKDYRLLGIASLNVAIDSNLKLKISYNLTHDSEPPALVKKTDSRYVTGFEYSF